MKLRPRHGSIAQQKFAELYCHRTCTASAAADLQDIPELQGCGAGGAALVSAIFSAKDIEAECRDLRKIAEETFLE